MNPAVTNPSLPPLPARRRTFKVLRAALYFAAMPAGNVLINALWHRRLSGRYLPRAIYLETTNCCNARCIMCPHEKLTRPRGHMPWELFTKIVDECATFEGRGLKIFLHKDGEPLMDPLLFDRIRYAKAKLPRSRVHFNTNAALLDEDQADRILQAPLDSIVFSVDGASAETYERIRAGLDYAAVRRNIERFLELRRARGGRLHVIMQMVVDRANRHEILAYTQLWGARVDELVFKPMHNFLVQGTALSGGDIGTKQGKRCMMPFQVMLFYTNGDVALCCWDYDHAVALGNVKETRLLDLYNSPAFAAIRAAMRGKRCHGLKPCNVCSQIFGHDGPMWA